MRLALDDHPMGHAAFLQQSFSRYAEDLRALARRLAGEQEAEDVLHDTYLHWLPHPAPESVRDLRAFLFTIAANLARDARRKHERRSRHRAEEVDLDALVSPWPGPEDAAEWAERFERFREALAELPELYRHAFLLNRFRRFTHAEIAKRLGLSRKTVERYIRSAAEHCAERSGLRDN
ncbi:MAG: RNA polymerase sigma factor [Gammaproteobacteria bacterium]